MSKTKKQEQDQEVAKALQDATVGVRFRRFVFGATKRINASQQDQMAATFDADSKAVKGQKVLLDTHREEYRRVTGRVLAAMACWREMTVPFEDVGVRLIKRDKVQAFEKRMKAIQAELDEAVAALDAVYQEAREQAQARLGSLYDPKDYPDSLTKFFGFVWDFPSIEPAAALKKVAPELYAAEEKRIAAKFAQAVIDAEAMFAAELHKMLVTWVDKLTPDAEGKRKVIRKDALEGFKEVLARIEDMAPVGGSKMLAKAVEQAKKLAVGLDISKLKTDSGMADVLKEQLAEISSSIEILAVDEDERSILLD